MNENKDPDAARQEVKLAAEYLDSKSTATERKHSLILECNRKMKQFAQ